MKNQTFLIYCLMLVSIFCSSCQADSSAGTHPSAPSVLNADQAPQILPKADASISGHQLKLMLARSADEKAKGLMFFDSLSENEGMLFVYPAPRLMSFWMYNTKIELDLVFFSDQLLVTEFIEAMQPGYGLLPSQLPRYVSQQPAQYALELKSGMIKQLGLAVGDRLDIPITLLYSD